MVNQEDLLEALQKRMIWGAGLDVMYPEPLSADHPLTKLPNCGKCTKQQQYALEHLSVESSLSCTL